MKPKRTIAAAALAGVLGVGAAAATLPAGGTENASATGPTAEPLVRTRVVRKKVHRTRHVKVHRTRRAKVHPAPTASTPSPAPTAPAPAPTAPAPTAPASRGGQDDGPAHDLADDHGDDRGVEQDRDDGVEDDRGQDDADDLGGGDADHSGHGHGGEDD